MNRNMNREKDKNGTETERRSMKGSVMKIEQSRKMNRIMTEWRKTGVETSEVEVL